MKIKSLPDLETLNRLFSVDFSAGVLRWKIHRGRAIRGAVVGFVQPNGYLATSIGNQSYYIHRIIWKMATGSDPQNTVDHKNGDRADSRLENLREATFGQNMVNSKPSVKAPLGIKGIHLFKQTNRWSSGISVNGKKMHLGYFATPEEAADAYKAASLKFHGEFSMFASRPQT